MATIKLKRNYKDWYDFSPLLSFNASIYIILSSRNIGKTWSLKSSSLLRGIKRHQKTMFVRMFREERDRMMFDFLSPKLLDSLGIDKSRIKISGHRVYYNFGRKSKDLNNRDEWDWIISGEVLSQHRTLKSADDPRCTRIVFDEFLTDRSHLVMYRGDWVNDIQQLMVTIGRDHKLETILLGNKEIVDNALFKALGIGRVPPTYQGIKTYCGGGVVLEQINEIPDQIREHYAKGLSKIFSKTGFDSYLTGGSYNCMDTAFILREPVPNKKILCSFLISNLKCSVYYTNTFLYICTGIDPSSVVITDTQTKYTRGIMYSSSRIKDTLNLLKIQREHSHLRFENESALNAYEFVIQKCKV